MSSTTSRRAWLYGAVGVAAAAAGAGGAWWSQKKTGGAEPAAGFWDQRFERPEGGEVAMQAFKGKPLLLNFWATWCAPCVEEMPMIDAFFRQQASKGWQVAGLAIDQPSSVRKFLQRTPVTYPIGLAGMQGTDMLRQLGNTGGGLPFTLVIGADGAVAARKMGKLEPVDLDAWIRDPVHG